MIFLADVNVEKHIIDFLKKRNFDIKWMLEENDRLEDTEILKIANFEKRILITNDKDFGEIVFRQKLISSGIILFRIKDQNPEKKVDLMKKLLDNYKKADLNNYFTVIGEKKIRKIKLNKRD